MWACKRGNCDEGHVGVYVGGGGKHMLKYTGMCCRNVFCFFFSHKKSPDMESLFVKKSSEAVSFRGFRHCTEHPVKNKFESPTPWEVFPHPIGFLVSPAHLGTYKGGLSHEPFLPMIKVLI